MLSTFLSLPASPALENEAYTFAWRPAGAKALSLATPPPQDEPLSFGGRDER